MSYQALLEKLKDSAQRDPHALTESRQHLTEFFLDNFSERAGRHQIELAGAVEHPELLSDIARRASADLEAKLRESVGLKALDSLCDDDHELKAQSHELARQFRMEAHAFTVSIPFTQKPQWTSLALITSLSAFLGALSVFWMFRGLLGASPEASLFWAMLTGIPIGSYLLTSSFDKLDSPSATRWTDWLSWRRWPRLIQAMGVKACHKLLKQQPHVDWEQLEQQLDQQIHIWTVSSWPLIAGLCAQAQRVRPNESKEYRSLTVQLGEKLLRLQDGQHNELPTLVSELLNTARALGFDLPDKPAASSQALLKPAADKNTDICPWDNTMASRYRRYDFFEEGDLVRVIEHPVCINGRVHKKGLVRRYWKDLAA